MTFQSDIFWTKRLHFKNFVAFYFMKGEDNVASSFCILHSYICCFQIAIVDEYTKCILFIIELQSQDILKNEMSYSMFE
jgi:hypothetical protein